MLDVMCRSYMYNTYSTYLEDDLNTLCIQCIWSRYTKIHRTMYFSVSEAELDTQCTCDKYVFQIRIVHVCRVPRQRSGHFLRSGSFVCVREHISRPRARSTIKSILGAKLSSRSFRIIQGLLSSELVVKSYACQSKRVLSEKLYFLLDPPLSRFTGIT